MLVLALTVHVVALYLFPPVVSPASPHLWLPLLQCPLNFLMFLCPDPLCLHLSHLFFAQQHQFTPQHQVLWQQFILLCPGVVLTWSGGQMPPMLFTACPKIWHLTLLCLSLVDNWSWTEKKISAALWTCWCTMQHISFPISSLVNFPTQKMHTYNIFADHPHVLLDVSLGSKTFMYHSFNHLNRLLQFFNIMEITENGFGGLHGKHWIRFMQRC